MAIENQIKFVILSRNTYDTRFNNNSLDTNTIYFIKENSPQAHSALSMCIGYGKITDVLNINDLLDLDNPEKVLNHALQAADLNSSEFKIPNKLFIYEDINTGIAQSFVYSTRLGSFVPCQGALTWEHI